MVSSLEELEQISGYGKPLLRYHVQDGKENKGLADLGLVDVDKGERGKIVINITTLGKLMITWLHQIVTLILNSIVGLSVPSGL